MSELTHLNVPDHKVLARLGRGGMATVYLARDETLGRLVAIKVMDDRLEADPGFVRRFEREARIAAGMSHPNIVPVYRYGTLEDGRQYLVMSYVEGGNLRDRLKKGPLPVVDALAVLRQVANALTPAHSRNIVHRDLKPDNILFQGETALLSDFGIAKMMDATQLTEAGSPGTVKYMSPEQAQGQPIDQRTDIYALGVVLYEMLTANVPNDGDSVPRILMRIAFESPDPLPANLRGLQPLLDLLLAKQPADRLASCSDLVTIIQALERNLIRGVPLDQLTNGVVMARSGTSAADRDQDAEDDDRTQFMSADVNAEEPTIGVTGPGLASPRPAERTTPATIPIAANAQSAANLNTTPPPAPAAAIGAAPSGPTTPASASASSWRPQAAAALPASPRQGWENANPTVKQGRSTTTVLLGVAGTLLMLLGVTYWALRPEGGEQTIANDSDEVIDTGEEQTNTEQIPTGLLGRTAGADLPATTAEFAKQSVNQTPSPIPPRSPGSTFADPLRMGGQGPQMLVVGSGQYQRAETTITIANQFAIGAYEVTFDDYDRFAQVTQRELPNDNGFGRGMQPVINVTFNDAQAYVAWLSEQTGNHYRLLSENEWEYVARAGTTTAYTWGDELIANQAVCDGCGTSFDDQRPAPVGTFAANSFGAHDLHGNVWEWVEDCLHSSMEGAPTDASAWVSGDQCAWRILRGGGYTNDPERIGVTARYQGYDVNSTLPFFGFRVARDF